MKKPLKILFLGEPKSANTVNWVEGFRNLGCQVEMASARSDGTDGAHPIGSTKLPPRVRLLTGLKHVKDLIQKIQPDILLGYRVTSYGYLAAKTQFRPLVLAAQNEQITYMDRPSYLRERMMEYFARIAIQRADLIHAWGHNIKNGLLKFGADEKKIMVLHRGIDMTKFSDQDIPQNVVDPERPVFISTRTLSHEYLIDRLLQAFKILLNDVPKAKLIIAGDGPEKEALEHLANDLQITENVTFLGRLNSQEIAQQLSDANFYISLIQTEGISSSLIEACCCGIVPIVADIPASTELVSGQVNGHLLNSISPKQIASTMNDAIHNQTVIDGAMTNATAIQKRYDRTINLQAFIDAYYSLLKPLNG